MGNKLIPKQFDKRVKLLEEHRKEILDNYNTGLFTYAELSKMYNVSISTIRFIIHPEYIENRSSKKTEIPASKRKETMQRHKNYKRQLEIQGLLIEK